MGNRIQAKMMCQLPTIYYFVALSIDDLSRILAFVIFEIFQTKRLWKRCARDQWRERILYYIRIDRHSLYIDRNRRLGSGFCDRRFSRGQKITVTNK